LPNVICAFLEFVPHVESNRQLFGGGFVAVPNAISLGDNRDTTPTHSQCRTCRIRFGVLVKCGRRPCLVSCVPCGRKSGTRANVESRPRGTVAIVPSSIVGQRPNLLVFRQMAERAFRPHGTNGRVWCCAVWISTDVCGRVLECWAFVPVQIHHGRIGVPSFVRAWGASDAVTVSRRVCLSDLVEGRPGVGHNQCRCEMSFRQRNVRAQKNPARWPGRLFGWLFIRASVRGNPIRS
jgi:hypothetical protein